MAIGQLNRVLRHIRETALLRDGGGLTDAQLLEAFSMRQDGDAFDALVRRHGPMVLGVCRRVLRHEQNVEDAFQATFLVLIRKATSIAQKDLVANWLYGVAYRTAMRARTAIRRGRERQVSEMPEPQAPATTDPWDDLRPLLDRELNRLPDKLREPIVLCYLEGLTRRAAARQLGIPDGTLSNRLGRACQKLAQRLARYGFSAPGGVLAALSPSAASAVVPSPLVTATVRMAEAVLTGHALTETAVSAKIVQLANVPSLSSNKLKAVFLALLLVVGAGSTTGFWWSHSASSPSADADQVTTIADSAPNNLIKQQQKERAALEMRLRTKLQVIVPQIEQAIGSTFPSGTATITLAELLNNGAFAHVLVEWKPIAVWEKPLLLDLTYHLPGQSLNVLIEDMLHRGTFKTIDWESACYTRGLNGEHIKLFGQREMRVVYEAFRSLDKVGE